MLIKLHGTYNFAQLEIWLRANFDKALILNSKDGTSIMHVLHQTISSEWVKGDGILFYSDGTVHSANGDDTFVVIKKISF